MDERLKAASDLLTRAGACFANSHQRIQACRVVADEIDRVRAAALAERLASGAPDNAAGAGPKPATPRSGAR
jgi:hypothetical protein